MRGRFPCALRGFTLIEILVVCAIAAVALSMLVLRTSLFDGRRLDEAAESLSERLEAIRDEAIISGQLLGFSSDGKGYQFWRLDGEKKAGIALSSAGDLAAREFPGGVELASMSINGTSRPLGERIVFYPSGMIESFSLTLVAGEARVKLAADVLGRLELSHESP